MAEELGEVEEETDLENPTKRLEGLKKLQGLVSFLPTSKPFIGFGEHFPVDGMGKDGLASVANRRVEVMFFEQGHEPDVGILNEAPDVSELYQAESYERATVPERKNGARPTYELVFDFPHPFRTMTVRNAAGTYNHTVTANGLFSFPSIPAFSRIELVDESSPHPLFSNTRIESHFPHRSSFELSPSASPNASESSLEFLRYPMKKVCS